MPQEWAVGRARRRTPALVILVGLTLMLVAHVASCALHHADSHSHTASQTMSMTSEAHGAGVSAVASDSAGCSAGHDADDHPDHDHACCDPADRPADLRTSTASLVLTLLVLVASRRDPAGLLVPNALERAGPEHPSACVGVHLLRLVCVSRT
ncbi:hypothetical protein ACFYZB_00280 [Streptomyces sp. NPDC001852]|uniref:hypothetical protein n=1 Tax=Streptomyces sp. NPDC001852 TaxID=3364619 RepID=UPI0036B4FDDF